MEVVVYLGIALIIGSIFIAVIGGWDAKGTFQGFSQLFKGDDAPSYEKITINQFPREVLATWESCGLGTTDVNRTIYVSDDGVVSTDQVFIYIKAAGICRSLASAIRSCGDREDVVFTSKTTPAVLRLECVASTRKLIIT